MCEDQALIDGDIYNVTDDQLSASSWHNQPTIDGHHYRCSRLHQAIAGGCNAGWSALAGDADIWIQVCSV